MRPLTESRSPHSLENNSYPVLKALTARDLMKPSPVSIPKNYRVGEAARFLTDHGISAAPVRNILGHPIGVLSRSDIVRHGAETTESTRSRAAYYDVVELESVTEASGDGFQIVDIERTTVTDLMTPLVYSVTLETAVRDVLTEMLDKKVHRLFVVDDEDVLVGVVSALDIVRRIS